MIKLPKFTTQNMFDAETHYNLFMNEERFSKLLIHYEVFKKIKNIPGSIIECGVFKGTSFSRFAMLRELIGNKKKNKLVAFDVFSDEFPNTNFQNEKNRARDFNQSSLLPYLICGILMIICLILILVGGIQWGMYLQHD